MGKVRKSVPEQAQTSRWQHNTRGQYLYIRDVNKYSKLEYKLQHKKKKIQTFDRENYYSIPPWGMGMRCQADKQITQNRKFFCVYFVICCYALLLIDMIMWKWYTSSMTHCIGLPSWA